MIRILDSLSKHYSCITFDRRECGQSGGRVEAVTWRQYADQGKGLLDHLNPRVGASRPDEAAVFGDESEAGDEGEEALQFLSATKIVRLVVLIPQKA